MDPISQAHHAGRNVKPWVVVLARAGYAAKGIVYFLVGSFAFQAALGQGGQTAGSKEALQEVLTQPYGKILLGIIAVGLLGYAIWKFVEAATDPDNLGTDAKGMIKRVGYAVSGIIYLGLAGWSISLILGNGGSSQDSTQTWSAKLMSQPFGRWLVGLTGAIVIGVALYQLYQAYSAHFQYKFKQGTMNENQRGWAIIIGRIGHAARGVAFAMIGYFFIQAAVQYDPSQAGGLGKALQEISTQPHGPWLLGIMAVGLVAYGIYSVIEGMFRQFRV